LGLRALNNVSEIIPGIVIQERSLFEVVTKCSHWPVSVDFETACLTLWGLTLWGSGGSQGFPMLRSTEKMNKECPHDILVLTISETIPTVLTNCFYLIYFLIIFFLYVQDW